jgi:hypothetical protein
MTAGTGRPKPSGLTFEPWTGKDGAAESTVDALMWDLKTLGIAALAGENCRQRLSELSEAQLVKVIERLFYVRGKYPGEYPAITDHLMYRLDRLRK